MRVASSIRFKDPKTRKNWGKYSNTNVVVARGRFELPSKGPKPFMIVHYTTGLDRILDVNVHC